MIFRFLYKTISPSGKYYVGRHSTTNLNDGYLGSGKWIRSVHTKEKLTREILAFFDDEQSLKLAELLLLSEVITDPNNMNFSNNSSGFSFGELNPAKTNIERKRRSEQSWAKTQQGRDWLKANNKQFKTTEFREAQRQRSLIQLENGNHNFQKLENIQKKIVSASKRLSEHNPMHDAVNQKAASERCYDQLRSGTHNFQRPEIREKTNKIVRDVMLKNNPMKNPEIAAKFKGPKPKKTCPHCGFIGAGPSMYRFHFDHCKQSEHTKEIQY